MNKVLLLLSLCFFAASFTQLEHQQTSQVSPSLMVTQADSGTAIMSWDAFGSGDRYLVTVTDLSSNQTVANFFTEDLGATIGGLVSGHLVRFEVQNEAETVIIDLLVAG